MSTAHTHSGRDCGQCGPVDAEREAAPVGDDSAGLRARLLEGVLSTRWPNGDRLDGVTKRAAEMIAENLLAVVGSTAPAQDERAIAAKALRDWISEWPTTPDDGTFLASVARDGLARADRIERDGDAR